MENYQKASMTISKEHVSNWVVSNWNELLRHIHLEPYDTLIQKQSSQKDSNSSGTANTNH